MTRSLQTVCIQWPRLGPYHLARLRAAHAHLAAAGADLVALETAGSDATYDWRQETGEEPLRRVQVFPGATFESLPPRAIVAGVRDALDALDPDAVVINSYSAPDAQAALLWCRQHRRCAVCLMESTAADAPRTAAREWIKRQLIDAFDAALAGGSAQRDYLDRLGFPLDKVFFTCDAVDNAFFREGAEEARQHPGDGLPGLGDPTPFFLASNRFVARKNLPRLLRAYDAYREQAPEPWRLVMLGDGPEREALEQMARSIDGVTFAGFRQIEELPAYYGRAGAFVHPSLVEPWGLVVNEAMAAGTPVVVSDRVGSARDLVREGETGFTFDPESVSEMTARLTEVAALDDDARRRMIEAAQAHVEGWSPEAFARGLWDAVRAGQPRANRGPSAPLVGLLHAMWTVSRRVGSYYAVSE